MFQKFAHKLKIAFYYAVIAKLPHGRLLPVASRLRAHYVCNVLKITSKVTTHTRFEPNIYIGDGTRVRIGINCQINENVFIQAAKIGDNVLIAPNVAILSTAHIHERVDLPIVLQGQTDHEPPVIGDGAWLARNVIVMPGIHIGAGAIVAAGAVVVKDVEPNTVVGGVPARVIKSRNRDAFQDQ